MELDQRHSSSCYLAATAADSACCPTEQQSQPCDKTCTDVCVDSDGKKVGQADAVTSLSTQDAHSAKLEDSSTALLPTFDSSRVKFDSECKDCQLAYRNPRPDELVIYLHAYCYQVSFSYRNYVT